MKVHVHAENQVNDSFRVQQVYALYGVQVADKMVLDFTVDLPVEGDNWQCAAVVGASGTGKSRLAMAAGGDSYYRPQDWPSGRSLLDGFPKEVNGVRLQTQDIIDTLQAVGFSSTPHYLLPYDALSTGQKFRCDLARSLLMPGEIVWFDEYTSVVDREVAKFGSMALRKHLNRLKQKTGIAKKFVAVSCHFDFLEWIEADWVFDMNTRTLARGSLRRPEIELEIYQCSRADWTLFGPHHYLSSSLHQASQCYKAVWNGRDVAFCAIMHSMGFKNAKRITRVVTLPDFQGVGIGSRLCDWVAEHYHRQGFVVRGGTSHPAMRRHRDRSKKWRLETVDELGRPTQQKAARDGQERAGSAGRPLFRYTYVGE